MFFHLYYNYLKKIKGCCFIKFRKDAISTLPLLPSSHCSYSSLILGYLYAAQPYIKHRNGERKKDRFNEMLFHGCFVKSI